MSSTALHSRSAPTSNPRRVFHMTSLSPPPSSTMSDYGMWSFHIPAFRAPPPPPPTESPAALNDDQGHESAVSAAAAASPVFDARRLVVKREPAPLLVADAGFGAEVHRGTALRGSTFGLVDVTDDGHQQALAPSAVYHPFGPTVTLSPRLWTTESMAASADVYDGLTGPRMASCSAGSLSGSDGSCRPQASAVSSEDRSSSSPSARVQPLNTNSNTSTLLIGKPPARTAVI